MATVYKAQWPLNGDEVLVYEADVPFEDRKMILLPATSKLRKTMFRRKYIRVFFEGHIEDNTMVVDKFVRREEWL